MRHSLLVVSILIGCRSSAPAQEEPVTPPPAEPEPVAAVEPADASLEEDRVARVPSDRPPNTIYRSEIDRALEGGPGYLMAQLGPEPFRHGERFVGWELTRIFPDDPQLCAPRCDIEVGDIILTVDGDRLETPDAVSRLIERLPSMDTLEVHSLRDGKRRVVTYRLVDARQAR